ncbi:MAG: MerR family transcriptional regulator [Gammaproteobacteria bacterium (ex Lamellibrachia satsuma)]|nr:MAG: Hg(II)-responsive transcriptional regulator [Gammaproteobacteria bacterium (ex Lamellibrachia satsuma)]RRS33394.1 MAG: MerR family transcriptional regulator [Gammaproteobacteria bacterium (ex Lamellibrachia satsuma)]RRS35047.1 MAG: MerR family transcriptional regulator [Gammaproteobacteria bacterium (ex Lamellibrachia satsuma)]
MERTIGQLAKAAGINVETIRYYERRGLILQPEKPAGGFRSYPEDTFNRIRFIKRAQELGFSLDEVEILLNIDEGQCHDVQEIAAQKLVMIRQKMADLERLANTLDDWMQCCKSTPDNQPCPLIHDLIKNNDKA